MAPAARWASPITSDSAPIEPATIEAYRMNWPRSPPVMVPASTACAPSHSTKTMVPNTITIATIVSSARARMRFMAVRNAASTEALKRDDSMCSWVKACTVGIALRISPAIAEASAIRSCESRDSLRTRRPNSTIGTTTSTSRPRMIDDSLTLVKNSITRPPTNSSTLRSAIEMLVPTTAWINVVSVVMRDSTSPVCVVSKNSGLWLTTCAYTALRMSAVTRSPSHDTVKNRAAVASASTVATPNSARKVASTWRMLVAPAAAPKPRSIICLNAYGIASVAPAATTSAMAARKNWRRYGRRNGSRPLKALKLVLRAGAPGATPAVALVVLVVLAVLVESVAPAGLVELLVIVCEGVVVVLFQRVSGLS